MWLTDLKRTRHLFSEALVNHQNFNFSFWLYDFKDSCLQKSLIRASRTELQIKHGEEEAVATENSFQFVQVHF